MYTGIHNYIYIIHTYYQPHQPIQVASAHAYSGMYVLAVAARPLEPDEVPSERAEAERELTLLGAARG